MEFDQILDLATNFFQKVDPSRLHSHFNKNPTLRPSLLIHENREKPGFGPEKTMNIEMPSSEEDSECENENLFPSVRQVIEKIMDTKYILITVFLYAGRADECELPSTSSYNLWT